MKSNVFKNSTNLKQSGFYTVAIAALLIGASMIAVLGLTRSAVMETRVASNDAQTKEVQHAAEAAWDYGLAWYAKNEPPWVDDPGGTTIQTYTLPGVPTTNASNGDTYAGVVNYFRDSTNALSEGYALITSTATALNDNSTTASVRQYVHDNVLSRDPNFTGPPIFLKGCMTNTTATPDENDDDASGDAIYSLENTGATLPPCVDPGHLDVFYPNPNNPNNGLEINPPTDAVKYLGAPGNDLWWYIFNTSRDNMKEIAATQLTWPAAKRTVVWVYTNSSEYLSSTNYKNSAPQGSATSPIFIIFDEGFANAGECPGFTGNVTIWGVVFVDGDCPKGNGWGHVTINGTTAINGDVNKLTANTQFNNMGVAGGGDVAHIKSPWVARIPGSWRDF